MNPKHLRVVLISTKKQRADIHTKSLPKLMFLSVKPSLNVLLPFRLPDIGGEPAHDRPPVHNKTWT